MSNHQLSLNSTIILKMLIIQYFILILSCQSPHEIDESNGEFTRHLMKALELSDHNTISNETKSSNLSVISYLENLQSSEFRSDMMIGFMAEEIPNWDKNSMDANNTMWFNISNNLENMIPKFAEMKIYKKISDNENSNSFRIEIYQIMEIRSINDLHMIDSKIINNEYEGWITFDVTETFQYWTRDSTQNYGFHIAIVPIENALNSKTAWENIGIVGNVNADDSELPFIIGYYETFDDSGLMGKRSKRIAKRNAGETYMDFTGEKTVIDSRVCSKKTFTISFNNMGIDTVIAPKSFNAYYCTGDCDNPFLYPHLFTAHANYQFLIRYYNNSIILPIYCVPMKLLPIQVLYFNKQKQYILEKVPNMIVDSCFCQ